MKSQIIIVTILLVILSLLYCDLKKPNSPQFGSLTISLIFPEDTGLRLKKATITIDRVYIEIINSSNQTIINSDLAKSGSVYTGDFEVPSGSGYTIEIYCYGSSVLIFQGIATNVSVQPGKTTPVPITLNSTVQAVKIYPSSITLFPNGTQQFNAYAFFPPNNDSIDVTSEATWNVSSSNAGSFTSPGLFKASDSYIGNATINASYKGRQGQAVAQFPAKNVTITSPNGGESWQLGSTHNITWNSNAGGNVKIELYKQSSYYKTITSSASNAGSYLWNIPLDYDEYNNYKIKITSTSNASLYDDSDNYFSLTKAPYITVTSPNGDENWDLGSTHDITWNSNAGGNVKVELYKQSSLYKTIISSTPNDGSYPWNIPTDYDEYNNYKIRITSLSNPSIYDDSDNYFSLTKPPYYITVTSPNGGENWLLGEIYSIRWNSTGGGSVDIELYQGGNIERLIVSGTYDDGSYSWKIPTDLDENTNYKIKVSNSSNSSIYDFSDDYFSLSAKIWSGFPTKDTYVNSYYSDDNYGNLDHFFFEYNYNPNNGVESKTHSLLDFNVENSIPSTATVRSATLRLYLINSPEGAPFRVTIRLIATPWNENTVNWVYAQSMNFAATDMNPNNKVPITGSYVDFDVTDIVQTWIENRGKYGFYIKCYDESGNNKSALFHSRESTSTDKRPDLEIKYTQ